MANNTTKSLAGKRRFGFYFAMSVILAASLQLLLYVMLLDNTVGPFFISSLRATDAPAIATNLSAALVVSQATAHVSRSHVVEVQQWENFLETNHVAYRMIAEEELGDGLPDSSVLVLPGVVCLSDSSRAAIRKHLELGRGVIASGPVGSRDEHGMWRGWDFLNFLADVQTPRVAASGDPAFASFRGDTIYSETLPGGYRLSLQPQDLTIAQAATPDAYWSDWKLRPAEGTFRTATVATHVRHGAGRVVWFGFNPARAGLTDVPELLLSPLRWTGRKVMAVKASWPEAKTAGMVLFQELEGNPADSAAVVRLLADANLPSTLSLNSDTPFPDDLRAQNMIDFAWSNDQTKSVTGLSSALQSAVFVLGRRSTENKIGKPIYGASTPFGLTNSETPKALNDAGYRYYVEEINITRAVPELVEFPVSVLFPFQKSYVARIFATGSDDFQVIAHFDKAEAGDIALKDTFVGDLDRMVYLRGLYTLPFHTYLLGSPEYRNVLRSLIQDAKQRDLWVATAASAARWWMIRHNIDVDFEQVGPRRFRLGVTNRGDNDVEGFTMRLYMPVSVSDFDLEPALLQLNPPIARRLAEEDAIEVLLPHLKAQSHYPLMLQVK